MSTNSITTYEVTQPQHTTGDALSGEGFRENIIRYLLGTDYEFAKEQGLFDMFEVSDTIGDDGLPIVDGLIHSLIGDEQGGFHSETAVLGLQELLQQEDMVDASDEKSPLATMVKHNRVVIDPENKHHKQHVFEPYMRYIAIRGIVKYNLTAQKKDGSPKEANNSFFPKEYDVLTILQQIKQAYQSIDPDQSRIITTPGGDVLLNDTGTATMLDGKSKMPIIFHLDPVSKKIRSAFPKAKASSTMQLSDADIYKHLGLVE